MSQDERRVIEIEPDDLGIGETGSACHHLPEQYRFPAAGVADNQLIGHAAEVRRQVERLFAGTAAG